MGATKLEYYSQQEIRNAELAKAISNPARILILRHLNEHAKLTGPELTKILKIQKPTIQQHLDALMLSGLIYGSFEGNTYYWKLNPNTSDDFGKIEWAL